MCGVLAHGPSNPKPNASTNPMYVSLKADRTVHVARGWERNINSPQMPN